MSPRKVKLRKDKIINESFLYGRILFMILFFGVCLFPVSWARAENVFVKFYQAHISQVDGNRCPMYPSCSTYASQAIEKHGPALGWAMACDRLVRCGRDEQNVSRIVVVNNQGYIHDPVEANDFWWFEKEKKE